jgi:hypothetical protein
MVGSACRQEARDQPTTIDVTKDSPAEAQLAALQVNARRVPRALVAEFDQVLTALEIRCTETRAATPSLADVAVKAVAAATKNGQDMTHLQALRALENSIHEGADMKIDCTEAAKRLFSQF